jgi:hypothetical protein
LAAGKANLVLRTAEKEHQGGDGMREQRRARRFALDLEVLEIGGKPVHGARLINLSSNGARLELPFAARINEQLKVTVQLPGFTKPSTFFGRVAWKKKVNLEGRFVTGLQFYQNNWDLDQWLRALAMKAA